MTQEIIDGNRLIAEFMGKERRYNHYGAEITCIKECPINTDFEASKRFTYHSSWDWLMPVIEKISRYEYEQHEIDDGFDKFIESDTAYPRTFGMINFKTGCPMFRFNRNTLFEADTLIHAAWLACVDFIKYYNAQNKQQ